MRHYLVDCYNTYLRENHREVTVYAEYRDIATSVGISIRTVGRSIQKLKMNGEPYNRSEIRECRLGWTSPSMLKGI